MAGNGDRGREAGRLLRGPGVCSGGVFHKCSRFASHPLKYCDITDQSPHVPAPSCPHLLGPMVNTGKLTYISPQTQFALSALSTLASPT